MPKLGLFIRLEAKAGQEAELKAFLESALPLVESETSTPVWFAVQFGQSSFGIFDAFESDADRQAHMRGQVAIALMTKGTALLAAPPKIETVDVLAAKLPA